MRGFVYVLRNPAMPGIVKIGHTARSPFARAAELSGATAAPAPFRVVAYVECDDSRGVERAVHEDLAPWRLGTKEFFQDWRGSFEHVLDAIRSNVDAEIVRP